MVFPEGHWGFPGLFCTAARTSGAAGENMPSVAPHWGSGLGPGSPRGQRLVCDSACVLLNSAFCAFLLASVKTDQKQIGACVIEIGFKAGHFVI